MSLYPNEGIYAPSKKQLNWMRFQGAMGDLANVFSGRPSTNQVTELPQQAMDRARKMGLEDQMLAEREQQRAAEQERQAALDALNTRNINSQIESREHKMNAEGGGMNPIGSPQKLANGNIGVTVEDRNSPSGFRVVDTGTAYKDEPNLEEKFEYQRRIAEQKQNYANIPYIQEANDKAKAADEMIRAYERIEKAIDGGVKTGTFAAAFGPNFFKSPEMQDLIAQASDATLAQAEKLSGPKSDSDIALLKSTVFSADKKPEANLKILRRNLEILRRERAEAQQRFDHFQGAGNSYLNYKPTWEAPKKAEDKTKQPVSNLRGKYGLE